MQGPFETEVKIPIGEIQPVLGRLRELGYEVSAPRVFEANTLYDTAGGTLRARSFLLRLREVGGKHVLTFKGPGKPGRHKSREELETQLSSGSTMDAILNRLEYRPSFRYEKFRTEYRKAGTEGDGVVTVDETPIGHFLELEGPGDWIDRTAGELGFSAADYVLESYGRLYLAECARRGVEPSHMIFSS